MKKMVAIRTNEADDDLPQLFAGFQTLRSERSSAAISSGKASRLISSFLFRAPSYLSAEGIKAEVVFGLFAAETGDLRIS